MKNVLVTGGTGSVGRALVERLLVERPEVERITVYSRDEHKQGDMARAFSEHEHRLDFVLGDIRDRDRLGAAMHGVDTVVHTAAIRLVPHAEANPTECMRVNVEGAIALAAEASRAGVSKVVAISSDKAVAPTTTYGASKFMMERILLDADRRSNTRFSLVRYANILNSRSSVAPLFLQQRQHGFLTITDPNMTRFSIVMREGIDLILFALDYGWGGELICPRSPSYRVGDMAMAIAPRVEHRLIGARPGEKLHETMFGLTEAPYVARRDCYYIVTPTVGRWTLRDYCRDIQEAEALGEVLEYASDANDGWLDVNALRSLIKSELGAPC